jgi:hypothetical protein
MGVMLDSLNLPKYNFFKVVYMTLANIIGDAIVVFAFVFVAGFISFFTFMFSGIHSLSLIAMYAREYTIINVLQGVAWVTIAFTLIGIFIGHYYLNQNTEIHIRKIFKGGILFFTQSALLKRKIS